jgi:hypothetical protein
MEIEAADEHRRDAPTGQGGSSGQKGAKTMAISMEAKSVCGSVKKGLDQGVFGLEEMEILSGSQGEGQNQGDGVCEVLDLQSSKSISHMYSTTHVEDVESMTMAR